MAAIVGDAGIPQEPALRVFDQVAGIGESLRFPDIHSRRPDRGVAGDSLAAIDDVELFDAAFVLRR
jgi:hypothetical protein